MYAEVVYEPGSKSVVSYDNLEELKAGLLEQHRRAVEGHSGGPGGHPAERVAKVYLYDDHPGSLNEGGLVSVDKVRELATGMAQGEEVSANQLSQALRDELSPVYPVDQGAHESIYKMPAKEELDLAFLSEDKV